MIHSCFRRRRRRSPTERPTELTHERTMRASFTPLASMPASTSASHGRSTVTNVNAFCTFPRQRRRHTLSSSSSSAAARWNQTTTEDDEKPFGDDEAKNAAFRASMAPAQLERHRREQRNKTYAMRVSYDGERYVGFQYQGPGTGDKNKTIQGELERCLCKMTAI